MRKLLLMITHTCVLTLGAQNGDSVPSDTLYRDLTFVSDSSRLSFTFNYGMGYTSYRLQTQQYGALKECRENHDKNEIGLSLAFNVSYELSDRFELVSGLAFFQTGFMSEEPMQLSDTLDMEFVLGCEIGFITDPKYGYVGNGFWDYRYAYVINGLHPKKADLVVQLHYNYIQIPFMVKTNFGSRRSRVFLSLGAGVNHLQKVKHTIIMSDDLYYFTKYVNNLHQPYYRRWNVSALCTIGAQHKMSKKFSIGLNLAGTYQLMSVFDDARFGDYVENHYLIAANFSMIYHFRQLNR